MIIEKNILPRNQIPIKNLYEITGFQDPENYHCMIYYVNDNKCDIIVRRIDSIAGWNTNLLIKIYSLDYSTITYIVIGDSTTNEKKLQVDISVNLFPIDITYEQKIPKVIIQTDESNNLSQMKYNSVLTLIELNPEYEYKFFDKRDRRDFIKKNFNIDVLETYDTLVPGAYRADLFRYCYLYIFGGCYVDCKMIFRKPFRELINSNDPFVFIQDAIPNSFANGLMMIEKNNARLMACINIIVQNVREKTYKVNKLSITGPNLLYSVFNFYVARLSFVKKNGDWCIDYRNAIILNDKKETVCYVYYNGYYQENNYKTQNHYSVLYDKKMVYFINKREIDNYKVYVFPHPWSDTFDFEFKDNQIIVKRTDKIEKWGQHLIIKVINNETNDEKIIDVGKSNTHIVNVTYCIS